MRTQIAIVVALLAFPSKGIANQVGGPDFLRFQLFNSCKPMQVGVEDLSSDAIDIGLSKRRIADAAEVRLRSARLYDDSSLTMLHVDLVVAEPVFHVSINYWKQVYDPATRSVFPAATWFSGHLGAHGGNAGRILRSLSEHLDRFILEYLRVNEDAC